MTKEELEIEHKRLEVWVDDLQSGMYINCVYCGHRYGPMDEVTIPMRKQLERHISACPKHPLSAALKEIEKLRNLLRENCSKQNFIPVWQGGYSGCVPDGGDVLYECRSCEVKCVDR